MMGLDFLILYEHVVREYESLLRMLHDKVEGEVLRRVRRAA